MKKQSYRNTPYFGIIRYSIFWSLMLLFAVPIACIFYGGWDTLLPDLLRILNSPAKSVTDYFELGSLAATFLNAALCGLGCNAFMLAFKAKPTALLLAGYFLVIAHCFYGLNFLNMWPCFVGILVYCTVMKKDFSECMPLAMFATSLGPFVSDLLFRYGHADSFNENLPSVTGFNLLLTLGFGLLSGFAIPALLPGTAKMHRGYNLYKAGLAIGLFGVVANAFFYKTLGFEVPEKVVRTNEQYAASGNSYLLFANLFFILIFSCSVLWGFLYNGKSFHGYGTLFRCDGWRDDFPAKFGLPLTFVNVGVYGLCVLAYMNGIILLTEGVGFTGPTVGVIIAAITFSASGQTPKNVWPIALGYVLLLSLANGIFAVFDLPIACSISDQGYINGMAFATGLCPIVGRYGRRYGVIAGMISATLCTSTAAMHGGFVLYNGGFTAGLTALLLIPILDFYHAKKKPLHPDL